MQNVTDRTSNPFGMEPPCERRCSADVPAVFGYGDANADVHVIGDHPGRHGGRETGVPFTGTDAGLAVQSVLQAVDLLADPGDEPQLRNCFLSYLHMCCPPSDSHSSSDEPGLAGTDRTPLDSSNEPDRPEDGRTPSEEVPSDAAYADLEPFFDAELRAIAAHVLVTVGERATAHAFEQYTARSADDLDLDELHATEVRGSGWLVFPLRDPATWDDSDRERAVEELAALLERDYRQTTDLGRFLATDDAYLVR